MIFIGTKENQAADALSRIEINNLMFLQKNDLNYSDMAKEQRKDEEIMRLFYQQDDKSLVIEEFKCQVLTIFCCVILPPTIPGRLFLKTTV